MKLHFIKKLCNKTFIKLRSVENLSYFAKVQQEILIRRHSVNKNPPWDYQSRINSKSQKEELKILTDSFLISSGNHRKSGAQWQKFACAF